MIYLILKSKGIGMGYKTKIRTY
ncbi:uncharacterized protein METZ01_LOCUS322655 [marine metagenome]|uniref:Uncharacterized protein n=1 Tax=marine metagenome TaxID=408172 RepID=A0A382PD45_9ZZZZ